MKLAIILYVVAIVCPYVYAQANPPPQNPPNQDMELNTVLMECTFAIEGKNAQGQSGIGTGFVLGRPYLNTPGKGRYVLITAAHVFSEAAGDFVILHLRRKTGENGFEHVPLPVPIRANGQQLWTKHPDADVAVIYIQIPDSVVLPLLPTTLLADDDMLSKFQIHPGDELECLGYPLGLMSNDAGFPILRSGKIASYPLLPTSATKTFLFDFRVFKGNSGGPVYIAGTNRNYQGAMHLGETVHFIVGLVSEEKLLPQVTVGVYDQEVHQLQLGLAVVVHSSLIKQTIDMLPAPDTFPH
jgi:S1-C subfamily serine protease